MTGMNKTTHGKSRYTYGLAGLLAVLAACICLLFCGGNTAYAQETAAYQQTGQHKAAITVENESEEAVSPVVHILAFGLVLAASAAAAGILIGVRKRKQHKK